MHNFGADDSLLRASICSNSTPQIQQQHHQDGPPQEFHIREPNILPFHSIRPTIPILGRPINTFYIYLGFFQIIVISWILGLGIIGINIYYLSTGFVGWLIHNNLHKVANVFIGIVVFPLMATYILAVIYLTFRKDRVVTYIEPEKDDPMGQAHLESGLNNAFGPRDVTPVPFREDLAHIPLPEQKV